MSDKVYLYLTAVMETVFRGIHFQRAADDGNAAMSPERRTLRSRRKNAHAERVLLEPHASPRHGDRERIGDNQFGWYRGSYLSSHVRTGR